MFSLDIFLTKKLDFTKRILFLLPSWALSQQPFQPSASWANDSEPIWAPVIIVKYCTLSKINADTDELISELTESNDELFVFLFQQFLHGSARSYTVRTGL